MGLFSAFEKIINIENINLGCKKTREEEIIKKLNAIFSIVAQNLIYRRPGNENIPKEIVTFIKNDINDEWNLLFCKKEQQINMKNKQHEIVKQNYIETHINNFSSAKQIHEFSSQYDENFKLDCQKVEQDFVEKLKKILNEIISQYKNGTRLNDTDFNKLCSYFKDDKQIENCYAVLIKSP